MIFQTFQIESCNLTISADICETRNDDANGNLAYTKHYITLHVVYDALEYFYSMFSMNLITVVIITITTIG